MDVVALVETNGVTIPASWNHGVLKHHDRIYAFSSWENAMKFVQDHEDYMLKVFQLAQGQPELVQFLHLHSYFPAIEGIAMTPAAFLSNKAPVITAEVGTQVETHFEDSHIERDYHWNEWEMRRRALMLVNLRNKVTHSTQSSDSHFRRDGVTQSWLPKIKDTQTSRETGTTMPKAQNFIAGLRGSGKEPVRVLDLTLNL